MLIYTYLPTCYEFRIHSETAIIHTEASKKINSEGSSNTSQGIQSEYLMLFSCLEHLSAFFFSSYCGEIIGIAYELRSSQGPNKNWLNKRMRCIHYGATVTHLTCFLRIFMHLPKKLVQFVLLTEQVLHYFIHI